MSKKVVYLPNNYETEPSKKWLEHTYTYKDYDGRIKLAPCCHLVYEINCTWEKTAFKDYFARQTLLNGRVVKETISRYRQPRYFVSNRENVGTPK